MFSFAHTIATDLRHVVQLMRDYSRNYIWHMLFLYPETHCGLSCYVNICVDVYVTCPQSLYHS